MIFGQRSSWRDTWQLRWRFEIGQIQGRMIFFISAESCRNERIRIVPLHLVCPEPVEGGRSISSIYFMQAAQLGELWGKPPWLAASELPEPPFPYPANDTRKGHPIFSMIEISHPRNAFPAQGRANKHQAALIWSNKPPYEFSLSWWFLICGDKGNGFRRSSSLGP